MRRRAGNLGVASPWEPLEEGTQHPADDKGHVRFEEKHDGETERKSGE